MCLSCVNPDIDISNYVHLSNEDKQAIAGAKELAKVPGTCDVTQTSFLIRFSTVFLWLVNIDTKMLHGDRSALDLRISNPEETHQDEITDENPGAAQQQPPSCQMFVSNVPLPHKLSMKGNLAKKLEAVEKGMDHV